MLLRRFSQDRTGTTAAEFALVLPVLGTIIFGVLKFGIVYNNYLSLTAGVANAERQFASSRSVSTTPLTDAKSVLTATAPSLLSANLTVTAKVNGTACANDSACSTALGSAAGLASQMVATYPCDLVIMGIDFGGGTCTLSAQATERVE